MSKRRLWARPDVEFLKREAKELLSEYRREKSNAIEDFGTWHSSGVRPKAASLSDAQVVLARAYRFLSWARLKLAATLCRAIYESDVAAIRALVRKDPQHATEPARGMDTGASWGTPITFARFFYAAGLHGFGLFYISKLFSVTRNKRSTLSSHWPDRAIGAQTRSLCEQSKSYSLKVMNSVSHPWLSRIRSLVLQGLALGALSATADVDQLWITEVIPSTGEVEVTNVGTESVNLSSAFTFCHRFNYSTQIPSGIEFAPGESKVYTLNGLNSSDSDLFLYRVSSFGSPDAIISGLRFGPSTAVGRTSVATNAGIWPAPTAAVEAPPAGDSLALVGPNPFAPENWAVQAPDLGRYEAEPVPSVEVRVTIENLAGDGGTFLTPLWVGVHDGSFDSYDAGLPSSPGIERIAEDGNPGVLSEEFQTSGGRLEAVLNDIGPIGPGQSVSTRLWLDPNADAHAFFSYVSMVIPSNDAYVANGNPTAYPLFGENGDFLTREIMILGSDVNDAGTEINDELPENTAFFGQGAPNTGETENGVNTDHPGFKPASEGGILADPMFANADFTASGYTLGKITVRRVQPKPTPVSVTFRNGASVGGTFQTPVWIGVHDGSFDLFDLNSPASEALERLAEDGTTAPISQWFQDSGAGRIETTVISNGEIPPFAPGESTTITLELDANDPQDRYLSFASMVIPSNDAFVGNSDPKAYPIFDEQGMLVQERIIISNLRVYDAGTEVNDELPENTAFLAQMAPNTGVIEGGVVTVHSGFQASGSGGVLDQESFTNAGINVPGQQPLEISIGEGIQIEAISIANGQSVVTWSGGSAPFTVQGRSDLSEATWITLATSNERSATLETTESQQFFRILEGGAFPSEIARFSVEFNAQWSRIIHPTDFPGNPHFSGLIGSTHNADLSLWGTGGTATSGMRNMAETGGKSPLTSEIASHQSAGTAENLLSGGGIGVSPGRVSLEFEVSLSHPLVSLVSMIAPSPDWFVGVHDLSLLENGNWVDELVVPLEAYDAGTDSGSTFTSSNQRTIPQGTISRLTVSPFAPSDELPPLGWFAFKRMP